MAQFDVHRLQAGQGLVVDCQTDLLDDISTRFVVPLVPSDVSPRQITRLNPMFSVGDENYVLVPQLAASVPTSILGKPIGSLADEYLTIANALDMLISGF